ncbi:hypothetical protein IAG44_19200 [Streptomyces roseirectus]|uniref:Uncharacterized protein n=1 Tax=Streptomyces roseirectus TaxID=2768066 RepID=A0A7H0IEY4_9ACTN|nr:hypothetical protein [Streptomyces roseirectus]QNP71350.1 hypothetical protein IAG44_19200 [Streptomyces roseirectus]
MEPGTLLYDPTTDKVGEFQARSGKYAMLRPVGGGIEWQADPDTLRPPTDSERIGAGVKAANAQATRKYPLLEPTVDITSVPEPYPNCASCADLVLLAKSAGEKRDLSAQVDARVLMRQHHKQAHLTRADPA